MADAGIRIYNDYGTVQIDQDYTTLAFVRKGQVTMVDDGQVHPQKMVVAQVSSTGQSPMIAFRANADVNLERTTVGASWTWYFRAQSTSPVTLEYWIFDVTSLAAGAGTMDAGLRVFREDGSVAFDAATKPLRIIGINAPAMPPEVLPSPQDYGSLTRSASIATPAGRSVAVIQGTMGWAATMFDEGQYGTGSSPPAETIPEDSQPPLNARWRLMQLETYHSTARVSGNTVTCGIRRFESFRDWYPFSQTPHVTVDGQIMHWVIDVTHY